MEEQSNINLDRIIEDLEYSLKCIKDNKNNISVLRFYLGKIHFLTQNLLNTISNN